MSFTKPIAIAPNVYYTIEETAQLLRVSPDAVRRLIRSGQARGVKIGRAWRILGQVLLAMPYSEAKETREWYSLAQNGLAAAFGETEPEYTLNMIESLNPLYQNPQ